jgi:hypothetical protein
VIIVIEHWCLSMPKKFVRTPRLLFKDEHKFSIEQSPGIELHKFIAADWAVLKLQLQKPSSCID